MANKSFWVGSIILLLIIACAVFAPLLAVHDPTSQNLAQRLVPPFWHADGSMLHVLGTDHLGRDYFARLLYGARTSLTIGVFTIIISGFIGIALGLIAGYWGNRADLVVNFILMIRLTLPVVLIALVIVAIIGNSLQLLIIVIGCLLWDRFAIVTRTLTRQLVGQDFITSARCIGSSNSRILFKEIIPNLMSQIIIVASIELAHAILIEAALSFLGLGVQPPLSSWGLMISEAKSQIFFRPWLIAIPGAALVTLIFAINILGDALRDIMAPDGGSGT